jgi:zinc-binding alcohol dehydrogenase/oxidoreductase
MKAIVLNAVNQPVDYQKVDAPKVVKGSKIVAIKAAALNHRDLYITQGLYAGIQLPCILGSDGAGECGGKKVLINPSLDWGADPRAQGRAFRVLGMPDPGTFAEYIAIPKGNVYDMPAHLSWEQGAALPLAGLTAFRTLFTRCTLKKGEKVLISGVGGGVALLALQFAVAAGAEVFVTSGTQEKIERAVALGAKGGVNYKLEGWDKQLKQMAGGFDVIIDSAAGDGFPALAALCNPGGRIGIYGGTLGKINNLSPQIVFWKQISILGSTMGTPQDFKKMLGFVSKHEIIPIVDAVFLLENAAEAFQKMDSGAQFGKLVLNIN